MIAVAINQSPNVSSQRPQELSAEGSSNSITCSEVHPRFLSLLKQNPGLTQRQLADKLWASLGKINYCLRALGHKGLAKWGNFSKNSDKIQYMHLLTPKGNAQKLMLATHCLQPKEREIEKFKRDIERLRADLSDSNSSTGVAMSP